MRKNKMMRVAAVLAVAALLTTSALSGTFAKYTSSASASDSARVAKWSFKVGDKDIVANETISFDLFNTVKEATLATDETHIQSTDGSIIAPGTGGSFAIVLKNESEVTAKYGIKFTATNASNVPIEYTLNKDATNWESDISKLNITADDTNTALTYKDGTKTIDVYWRWAFTDTSDETTRDKSDTELGKAGTATVEVKADITATQVD